MCPAYNDQRDFVDVFNTTLHSKLQAKLYGLYSTLSTKYHTGCTAAGISTADAHSGALPLFLVV